MRGEMAVIMDFENILSQLLMSNENRGEHMRDENIRDENIRNGNVRGEKMEKMPEKMPERMPEKSMEKDFVRGAEMGDLPCEAPIAMTYTPWQRSNTPKFTAGEALDRGTLWPGLELPWKNNFAVRNVANGPLGELQALEFALVELALFLDTHPDDMETFQLFKKYAKAYHDKKMAYIKTYGPIVKADTAEADRWTWIDDPWPWDYSDRR